MPIEVKPFFTAYVKCGHKEYYPTILPPDLTTMAAIPSHTIPVGVPGSILPPLDGIPSFVPTGVDCSNLTADTDAVSLSAGGAQNLFVHPGPAYPGFLYLVAGSASGTGPFPLDAASVPLTLDAYTLLTVSKANSAVFKDTLGFLDADGAAYAAIALPPGLDPGLAGLVLHHAGIVFNPVGPFAVSATIPKTLTLVP